MSQSCLINTLSPFLYLFVQIKKSAWGKSGGLILNGFPKNSLLINRYFVLSDRNNFKVPSQLKAFDPDANKSRIRNFLITVNFSG